METQDDFDTYLDDLRKSGVTSMFVVGVYLQEQFGLDEKEAQAALTSWMKKHKEGTNNDT